MYIETELMNRISVSFAEATTLSAHAQRSLGISNSARKNDGDDRRILEEARRIHRRRRQIDTLGIFAGKRRKRSAVAPMMP
jgi:hypothetical protein